MSFIINSIFLVNTTVKTIILLVIPLMVIFITTQGLCEQEIQTTNSLSLSSPLNEISTRHHNIALMHSVLSSKEYRGYDVIIISSTTEQEAAYQQQNLEKAFSGTVNKDGRSPLILSVVDLADGGQIIGALFTWFKAEEKMRKEHPDLMVGCRDFLDYLRTTRSKVAVFHNGGKGERCSPLTQSLGNSRGAQKLVGTIRNAVGNEIELEVLLGVILQCSSFASTNLGTHIDTFWTSQIAFGSLPHDHLVRSNYGLDKFLVGFDKDDLVPQNIADFGTAALSETGRMIAFYGNKRFATRKGNQYVVNSIQIENELLSKGERFAYDFGSFSCTFDLWQLFIDFWKMKNVLNDDLLLNGGAGIKRDIDPHFIQPFIRILYAINDLADRNKLDDQLSQPEKILIQENLNDIRQEFDRVLQNSFPIAHAYIWNDVNQEKDAKKKKEAISLMHEAIEFYLLFRHTSVFFNLTKVFGYVDLGNETQWFRYRRPIDIMNEKLEMLSDMMDRKIEMQLNGSLIEIPIDKSLIQRCAEARLMRGIQEDGIVQFTVDGKRIKLTFDDVKKGIWLEGIYIRNSIIQGCELSKGSRVINSVLNQVTGKVIATNSYLESSTAVLFEADASVVHEVVDMGKIKADKEVVSDVYRTKLKPSYHGRMRTPIGYDPKGMPIYSILGKTQEGTVLYSDELDETIKYFVTRIPYDLKTAKEYSDHTARTEDGLYTFDEIRNIEPLRLADQLFRNALNVQARKNLNLEVSKQD